LNFHSTKVSKFKLDQWPETRAARNGRLEHERWRRTFGGRLANRFGVSRLVYEGATRLGRAAFRAYSDYRAATGRRYTPRTGRVFNSLQTMAPFPTRRTRSRYSAPGRAAAIRRARYSLPVTPARSGPRLAGGRSSTAVSTIARLANMRGPSTAGQGATSGAMARVYRAAAPGARHGNSGGFLKTTKKYKPNKKIMGGVAMSYEYAGVKTSEELCSFGHTTNAYNPTYRVVVAAVIKKLIHMANIYFDALESTPFSGDISVLDYINHDRVKIWWKKRDIDSGFFDETLILLNTDSLNTIINWMVNPSRPWNNAGYSEKGNMVLGRLEFLPASAEAIVDDESTGERHARYTCINLENVTVYVKAKSALKMQNRTVEEAGDDESDVNNVPLYGRAIEGNGSGPRWKNQKKEASVSFISNNQGIINVVEKTNLQEPPNPEEFFRVKKVGKVKIEPGEIRTSVLSHTVTKSFNSWYRGLNAVQMISASSPETEQLYPDYPIGKYRLFHIEKMLAAGTAYIKTAFEIQQNFVGYCKIKYPQTTIQTHFQNHALTY